MAIRNPRQRDVFVGVSINESGNDAERSVTSVVKMQTLVYTGGAWYSINHDTGAQVAVGAQYIPDFRVRAISIVGVGDANVAFELPLADNCLESFNPGVLKPFWITRLILDGTTTATRINLLG